MNNKIIILHKPIKLNDFRLKKINRKLKPKQLSHLEVFYLVEINENTTTDIQKLEKLLAARVITNRQFEKIFFIAPREGTISPWSSKATDILSNCGFESIQRIEHAIGYFLQSNFSETEILQSELYDKMIEKPYFDIDALSCLFNHEKPQPQKLLKVNGNIKQLDEIDTDLGLALSFSEKEYLLLSYEAINKEPTQTELMMFAQANSEHCRHKIFNATWTIDNQEQPKSLFSMIRNTEALTPKPAISAYKDNSAVFEGGTTQRWIVDKDHKYSTHDKACDVLIKVETHNHPTAISPFPGAATGSGGEIRDEAATGQGSRPKAGLTGFSVSHLQIPNYKMQWENHLIGKPTRIASALDIMLEAPLGGAAFNNEFGRPNICGYFRNLEIKTGDKQWRGYHKPIMLAGGLGTIDNDKAIKQDTQAEDVLVVLGGPAMLIGLGGSAASSVSSGSSHEDLDFASVQRGNPEMERRCQEVIDSCWTKGIDSPIRSIHDVGAGGLSNAMPELLDDAGLGGVLELRELQIDTTSMTPMEIWCNESQERYVLSIKPEKLEEFKQLCKRERCPYAALGKATSKKQLIVTDRYFDDQPVNIPMELLLGKTPKTQKNIARKTPALTPFDYSKISLEEAIKNVLNFPAVASKKYLITIGDRTVSGLVHRDQMVGPWQVPVADCGVTLRDFQSTAGEAMSIGEKAPLALIDGAASARMAVSEAILNLAGNEIGALSQIKLSANWMAASGVGREDEVLFDAVKAIGEELCPALGIGIPVGKDSLSMNSTWQEGKETKQMTSPVSLIISAFTVVKDVQKSITPYFDNKKQHRLYSIDLAEGNKRMGASALAQAYQQLGNEVPDLENENTLIAFWTAMQQLLSKGLVAAYHDVSDGGLFVSILEMCIASNCGATININDNSAGAIEVLFNEELGAVIAIEDDKQQAFEQVIKTAKISHLVNQIAQPTQDKQVKIRFNDQKIFEDSLQNLEKQWSHTSYLMASLRDNPVSCKQEFSLIEKSNNGIVAQADFDYQENIMAPYLNLSKPKIAIVREQGVNGQKEMAMAFHKAGFDAYDVHMQDLLDRNIQLKDFQGLAACGGFSYGDVLGAGKGWANSILFHEEIKQQFSAFFHNQEKFALGVCNGCQMLSSLKEIIPGAEHWPEFLRNTSEQFEARFSSLQINESPSLFFEGMQGAKIPVAIAHGEGRASYKDTSTINEKLISATYVDNKGEKTQKYPYNPNESQLATAAITNATGNIMIMMPHPERVFRTLQMSWAPDSWKKHDNSPWMRMFYNARKFLK